MLNIFFQTLTILFTSFSGLYNVKQTQRYTNANSKSWPRVCLRSGWIQSWFGGVCFFLIGFSHMHSDISVLGLSSLGRLHELKCGPDTSFSLAAVKPVHCIFEIHTQRHFIILQASEINVCCLWLLLVSLRFDWGQLMVRHIRHRADTKSKPGAKFSVSNLLWVFFSVCDRFHLMHGYYLHFIAFFSKFYKMFLCVWLRIVVWFYA